MRSTVVLVLALAVSQRAGGQEPSGALSSPRTPFQWRLGAMAVGAVTSANPALFGERYTEGYLTQPNIMGDVRVGGLQFDGTLNLEGYTLRRGELNAGMYGEGYVDRRHPHTLVHEAMLSLVTPSVRGTRASISAGKGFTPYGTDDPMMRPFVKYPVNHHHAQIIERALVLGAVAYGDPVRGRGAALEFALFNGDEPLAPFSAPRWSRVGDSRTARLTAKPARAVEVQASRAFVASPGLLNGNAFDHVQTSASVRYQRALPSAADDASHEHAGHGTMGAVSSRAPRLVYALAEYARTNEGFGTRGVFQYESALAEATLGWRGARLSVRGEQTERPESERLLDAFRTPPGHGDFSIIGVTRWRIATVHIASPAVTVPRLRGTSFVPFLEVARARADARRFPAVFEPALFYGNAVQWSVTAGVRLHAGTMRARMGRYGVLGAW